MDHFEYTLSSAHPNARALMKDDFFWSPIEETAPFGSDDGSDAAYGFKKWRVLHTTENPVNFLTELINSWGYPYFDPKELDTAKIAEYISPQAGMDTLEQEKRLNELKEAMKNSADTNMQNLSDEKLRELISMSSTQLGGRYLLGQDNAIIGIGFAQFVTEGRIEPNMKSLVLITIQRQLLPILINRYDKSYQEARKKQLMKMMEVIEQAGT